MYEFYLSRTRTTLSVIRLNVYCASRTIMHRFRSARATIPVRAYCMYTGEEFRLQCYVKMNSVVWRQTNILQYKQTELRPFENYIFVQSAMRLHSDHQKTENTT